MSSEGIEKSFLQLQVDATAGILQTGGPAGGWSLRPAQETTTHVTPPANIILSSEGRINSMMRERLRNQCTTCGATFSDKSNLRRHERVHTGHRPYRCVVCGAAFAQSNNLKAHVKNVHTNKQ